MEGKYDFTTVEPSIQKFWEQNEIYKFRADDEREIYSIDTPPPTVSGSLHIGHIFSYTQAEMIARYKRMQGYNVFYPFGFDDNGLPTERLVERHCGVKAKDLPRDDFIGECMRVSEKYEDEFKSLWKSMGFSVDWSLQYRTIGEDVQRISQKLFLKLAESGKAYMKESPVLWCTECRTSIAQAELETADKETNFITIPFTVGDDIIQVATTRPELLCGCVCLFVNPADERYRAFVGKTARVPLYDFEIPIMEDGEVSMDKGTGAVMCATFGDSTDAEWYEKYNLPYKKVLLESGTIDEKVPYIGGLPVHDARHKIIGMLGEKGLLLGRERITHTVATHERCGTEIEIIPSRQWYIDILGEKERFLRAADEINWFPAYMKERYISWVENLKWDWCISRQRYFGVPFPVWYCKNCGKAMFADAGELPVNPADRDPGRTCECGCSEWIPETAVFDTWATSSVTPQINARYGEEDDRSGMLLPMSMRTQAHEIIRTWAFYTIVRSLYLTGNIPWKDIMVCGFVLAKRGEKISKSKSNADFDPPTLIKTQSADTLRYWAANSRLGTDTFFSVDELSIARRFLTKLWNASKFSMPHLQDFEITDEPELLPVDRWIIERVKQTIGKAKQHLDRYEIGSARHEIDTLFWRDFCDNYLEIVKDRLYSPAKRGMEARRSAQYALYFALLNILKLYAIYVPHITEYIYQNCFAGKECVKSIHLQQWQNPGEPDAEILRFGERLKEIISDVRKYKTENNMSMKEELGLLTIDVGPEMISLFERSGEDIKACLRAESVKFI